MTINIDDSRLGKPAAADHGAAEADVLAARLSDLARLLHAADDTALMLDAVATTATQVIPGVEEASISSVVARQRVVSAHPTSQLPERVDAIQTETGEGPCLSAIFEQRTVRVPDLRREERWPVFSPRAADAGARSMLSFQLYVRGVNLGSLNLYSSRPDAFDDESEQVGLLYASHAAVAYADAKKIDSLQQAVTSRDLIGQAKGILMERYQLDADRAFHVLLRVSQSSHTRLRDVAEELVTTRRLTVLDAAATAPQTPAASAASAPTPSH